MLEQRFDDDWFIRYRHNLLRSSPFAFKDRQPHIVHNIIHNARLAGGVDRHIDQELRRLPLRHAGAVRAHMQFYRACLLSTGLVPADILVNAAVQIEWFWYNTAFTAFYRDHLAHVMKVAAIGIFLFQDENTPLAEGTISLVDVIAPRMADASLGSPAIRATARRCGNSTEVLRDPGFWKAAILETIRLAGLLHDMAHPAVIASRMSRIAAPVRPLSPFEPTERDLCRQTVAAFGHRLMASPFNRGELPDSKGLAPQDAEACANVFMQSHSLRAGYAIIRLAEEADRVWQLGPFDAFVMEWAALAVSLHDYYRIDAMRFSDRREDEALSRWIATEGNDQAIRPCFERDPVSYILSLADQMQDFGRVLGPMDTQTLDADKMQTGVRYPCKAVTLRGDRGDGDGARLIFELGPDNGTCFGATDWDHQLIKKHKESDAALVFGAPGHGGWMDHQGLLSGISVEILRPSSEAPGIAPVKLFYSFAQEDEALRIELEKHLANLKRQGLISDWHHRRIDAGRDWRTEVDAHLSEAEVILLLVSKDFIYSDYCRGVEMDRALELHRSGAARVIPILTRSVLLDYAPFAHIKALPSNGVPVKSWPDADNAWTNVVQGILAVVEDIRRTSGRSTS
jgi:hypothetical protein